MNVKGSIHYDRLVNTRRRMKVYDDVEVFLIQLDCDIDPRWPGSWWGRVELEGVTLDVVSTQKYGDTPETVPDSRVWRVQPRFNYQPLKVNITDKDVNDFLVERDILPTRMAIESVRRHLSALAFAWASAEMQDAKREDVLEWDKEEK